jgi:hypothetical protein
VPRITGAKTEFFHETTLKMFAKQMLEEFIPEITGIPREELEKLKI